MIPQDILKIFKQESGYLQGHFQLTSGFHSAGYMQCALVLQNTKNAEAFGKAIAENYKDKNITCVVGPAMGGIIIGYETDYKLATAGIKALEEQPNDLTEIIKYMKVLCYSDTKLTYDQKVRIFRQFVWRVKLDESLNFELELYKTPIGEIPENFRSFPRKLAPPVAVKGAVLDGFGNVFGENVLTASQVTHSSSDL